MNGRLVYFSIIIIGTAVAVAVGERKATATIVVISEVVVLVVGIGLAVLLNKMASKNRQVEATTFFCIKNLFV